LAHLERILRLFLLLAALLGVACTKKAPISDRETERFVRVCVDYLALCAGDSATAALQETLLDSALMKEGMSKPQFDKIRQHLEAAPLRFPALLEKMEEQLQMRLQDKKEKPPPPNQPSGLPPRPRS